MKEQRCPHGFMRSMVGCRECGPVKRHRGPKKSRREPWFQRVEPLPFPMSCRFCRRGCHSPNHANMCARRQESLATGDRARQTPREKVCQEQMCGFGGGMQMCQVLGGAA